MIQRINPQKYHSKRVNNLVIAICLDVFIRFYIRKETTEINSNKNHFVIKIRILLSFLSSSITIEYLIQKSKKKIERKYDFSPVSFETKKNIRNLFILKSRTNCILLVSFHIFSRPFTHEKQHSRENK